MEEELHLHLRQVNEGRSQVGSYACELHVPQIYVGDKVRERTPGLFYTRRCQAVHGIGLPVLTQCKPHDFLHGPTSLKQMEENVPTQGKQKAVRNTYLHDCH